MPLLELDSKSAWENIFERYSRWPQRGTARLEPIAWPRITPSFMMEPGARVFTMGSCFARNIETHLASRGFDIPAYQLLKGSHIINKYNPYSMLQALRWGLGLDIPPSAENRLIHIGHDQYIDLHLHMVPTGKDECIESIKATTDLFSIVAKCQYFILTLGLIEVWFDKKTNMYINEPLNFVRHFKDNPKLQEELEERLIFRVLNYEEAYGAVKEIFVLLRDNTLPDPHAILTVSPVPLAGTFTGKDVMIANSYSKSLLRTVAESICSEFPYTDYFPSYESVVLSPPSEAWEKDGVHVKDGIVEFNVNRMLESYLR